MMKVILKSLLTQGVKLTFFPGSHLAPKYFKVVANSKKLVAMTHTQNHFYPVIVPAENSHELQRGHQNELYTMWKVT